MRNEDRADVGAVERELEDLGKVIRRAAGELTEKLDRYGVSGLDVTVTLNWINMLRRRREVMILELGRLGWKGEQATGNGQRGTGEDSSLRSE